MAQITAALTKAALVTGASRGVGAEVARQLAARGFDVAINYRSKRARAEKVAAEVEKAGREAMLVQADITEPLEVAAMTHAVRERFGTLKLLVLNASGGLEKGKAEDYAMRLNKTAQLGLLEAALPLMPPGSRAIFATSHLAHFYPEKPVPPDYQSVAESKRAGEDALRARIPDLNKRGVRLLVVSGDLIEGTITPKLLERVSPGLIERRREQAGTLPNVEDFATAIVEAALDEGLASGSSVYVGALD